MEGGPPKLHIICRMKEDTSAVLTAYGTACRFSSRPSFSAIRYTDYDS